MRRLKLRVPASKVVDSRSWLMRFGSWRVNRPMWVQVSAPKLMLSALTWKKHFQKVEQCAASAENTTHSAKSDIESTFVNLRSTVDSLSNDGSSLRPVGTEIRGDISEVIVEFQFQDRVSQILS
eukprot:UN11121